MGIVGFSIFAALRALTLFTSVGKRHSIGIGRFAYGVVGIVAVPIIFTVALTLANLVFTMCSPDTAKAFITSAQISSIKTYIDSQLSAISHILGVQIHWDDSTNLGDSLDKMIAKLNDIISNADQHGNKDLATACSNLQSELTTLRPMIDTD
jgi:hypothetical protein